MKSGTIEGVTGSRHYPNYNVPSVPELFGENLLVLAGLVCRITVMGRIYLATNRINGKQYVGQESGKLWSRRRAHEAGGGSAPYLWNAICKYGKDAFDWDVVYGNVPEEDLDRLEIECIAWFGSREPKGYNIMPGGKAMDSEMMKRIWTRPEMKAKRAATDARLEVKIRRGEAQKRAQNRPEVIAKHRDSARVAMNRPEIKAKIAAIKAKPEVIIRIRMMAKEANNRPEVKAKRAATNAKPEVRAKRSEAMIRVRAKPEVRAKHAATNARPEVRARRSEAVKKANAKPEVIARRCKAQNRPEVRMRKSEAQKKILARPEVKKKITAAIITALADPEIRKKMRENASSRPRDKNMRFIGN